MLNSENYPVFALISCAVCLQFVIVVIICLFRRRRYEHETLDESSCLLIGNYRQSDGNSPAALKADQAYMSVQYYVRGLQRLEYQQAYKSAASACDAFWYSIKDKELAKSKNKDRLFPLASGNCIAKVKPYAKMSDFMKNDGTLDIALDILLTIKDESCPYIFSVSDVKYLEDTDSLLILSEYLPKGSLRDRLLCVKPFHHLTKGQQTKKVDCGEPLSIQNIFSYAKQILMGLIFLNQLRYPIKKTHLWLHAGNLMIDGKFCKLSGFEVELLQVKQQSLESTNDDRAGLVAVGKVVFEMATGFPVNYSESLDLDASKKNLTLKRKEKLREIHFEYLKIISHPEVLQLVQFLSDEDKCASLHMSVHHPFFDQVDKFQPVEPEDATATSLKTLYRSLAKRFRQHKRSDIKTPDCGYQDGLESFSPSKST